MADLGSNGVVGIRAMKPRDFPAVALTPPASRLLLLHLGDVMYGNTRIPLDTQFMNPVANFTSDNNGTIIRLPALPAGGQTSGQRANSYSASARGKTMHCRRTPLMLPLDSNSSFTTDYNGNALLSYDRQRNKHAITSPTRRFRSESTVIVHSIIPRSDLSVSFCKHRTEPDLPATVPFLVSQWLQLPDESDTVPMTVSPRPITDGFIWGLPFFYGRDVYTVLSGANAGTRAGPFVAFK